MLMLDPKLKIKRSLMLKGILVGWKRTKDKLHFDENGENLLEQFTMVKLTRLIGASLNWTVSLFWPPNGFKSSRTFGLSIISGEWLTLFSKELGTPDMVTI